MWDSEAIPSTSKFRFGMMKEETRDKRMCKVFIHFEQKGDAYRDVGTRSAFLIGGTQMSGYNVFTLDWTATAASQLYCTSQSSLCQLHDTCPRIYHRLAGLRLASLVQSSS
jgi:hypothetical protein